MLPNPAAVGATVTLDATASTANGSLISYMWTITPPGGPAVVTSDSTPIHTFSPNVAGTWTVSLTVQDNAGRTGSVGPKNLIVQ